MKLKIYTLYEYLYGNPNPFKKIEEWASRKFTFVEQDIRMHNAHSEKSLEELTRLIEKINQTKEKNIQIIQNGSETEEQKLISIQILNEQAHKKIQKLEPKTEQKLQEIIEKAKQRIESEKLKKKKEITDFLTTLNISKQFQNDLENKNPEEVIKTYFIPDESIEKEFSDLETRAQHFNASTYARALDQYKIIFKLCALVKTCYENNSDLTEIANCAYAILIVFGGKNKKIPEILQSLDHYLLTHNFHKKKQPLHDAFIYAFPINQDGEEKIDLSLWGNFIKKAGNRAMRIFNRAPAIQKHLKRSPISFDEAYLTVRTLTYHHAEQYPELAKLCLNYSIPEYIFNDCLEIEKKRKTADLLPDIVINGADLGYPGYYLLKLPPDDPRTYLLGHFTGCCQSIDNPWGKRSALAGILYKENGFYVLVKSIQKNAGNTYPIKEGKIDYENYKIVGQGLIYSTNENNLCVCSWENKRTSDNEIIVPMLKKFAKEVTQNHPEIMRVLIGRNSAKTPSIYKETFRHIDFPEKMQQGEQSNDSAVQSWIYCDHKKYAQHINLLIQKINIDDFGSIENFKAFICPDAFFSKNHLACIEKMIEHPLIWQEIVQLYQNNLLNPENGNMFYRFWKNLKILLLNDLLLFEFEGVTFFKRVIQNYKNPNFCQALVQLKEANLLEKNIIQLTLSNFEKSSDTAYVLKILKQYHSLTEGNIEIIRNNIKYTPALKEGFLDLEKRNLLHNEINTLLLLPKKANVIAEALIKAKETGNEEVLTLFKETLKENIHQHPIKSYNYCHLVKYLYFLHASGFANKNNIQAFLNYDGNISHFDLHKLREHDILTDELISFFATLKEREVFLKIQEALLKVNAETKLSKETNLMFAKNIAEANNRLSQKYSDFCSVMDKVTQSPEHAKEIVDDFFKQVALVEDFFTLSEQILSGKYLYFCNSHEMLENLREVKHRLDLEKENFDKDIFLIFNKKSNKFKFPFSMKGYNNQLKIKENLQDIEKRVVAHLSKLEDKAQTKRRQLELENKFLNQWAQFQLNQTNKNANFPFFDKKNDLGEADKTSLHNENKIS